MERVAAVIVALRDRDAIDDRAARTKLALIEPIPAAETIDEATRALDALPQRRP